MAEKSHEQLEAQWHDDRRAELVCLTGAALKGLLSTPSEFIHQMTVVGVADLAVVYARNALAQIDLAERDGFV